ncbi:Hypothetical predicted protein [Drosophila guanche]|uniref:Uncharacterized protein n=1 Tax=Drosophila guanche TaxID=7266 RepID=A0A3B0K2Y0_DROGU|nr:Hypothetical predicted protein [Drosophila guanche]
MWKLSAIPVCFVMCAVARCQMIDGKFGLFERCLITTNTLTSTRRSTSFRWIMSRSFLQLKLLPMRHDHGYRPFFMNLTFDICAFFRNLQNENGARQLILRELFQTVKPYTNINHTCPYHHDVEVSKLWTGNLEARFLRHLPLPHGDYSLCLSWYTSSVHRATVKVYFRLTDS